MGKEITRGELREKFYIEVEEWELEMLGMIATKEGKLYWKTGGD